MKLFKTGEAAKFLGVSTKTIKNWRKSGKLTPIKTGENGYCLYADFQLGKIKNELGKLGNEVGKAGNFPTLQTRENVNQPVKQTREANFAPVTKIKFYFYQVKKCDRISN